MAVYSHSRLSSFEQCPQRFKFNYIDEAETEIEESVESFMGKRVHETLQKLYDELKFEKQNSLQELLDFYNTEWKKNWNDAILMVRQEYSPEHFRQIGERCIKDYYAHYFPFNQERTIATEQRIEISLDKESKYRLQGFIDRLTSKKTQDAEPDTNGKNEAHGNGCVYVIHDYKTTGSLPKKEDLEEDRQLSLYAISVYENYPDCTGVEAVWHFLAFDKEFGIKISRERLVGVKEDAIKLIKQIEATSEFPSKQSALCSWCEFRPICPNFKHLFITEKLAPEEFKKEDGVTLVNKYAALKDEIGHKEEELEQLRQGLIAYAKKQGINAVYGSGMRAYINSYSQMSFPKREDPRQAEFFKLMKNLGLWDEFAILDTYTLAGKINRKELPEEFLRIIEKYITRNEINKVNIWKK
jgi:putative RecB family exonuclease